MRRLSVLVLAVAGVAYPFASIAKAALPPADTLLAFENFSEYSDGLRLAGYPGHDDLNNPANSYPAQLPLIPTAPSFGFSATGYHETGLSGGAYYGPLVRPGPVVTSQVVSDGKSAGGGFNRIFLSLDPAVATYAQTNVTYVSFIGGTDMATQVDFNSGGDADSNRVAEIAMNSDTNLTAPNPNIVGAGGTTASQGFGRAIYVSAPTAGAFSGENQLNMATAEGKPAGTFDDTSAPFASPKYETGPNAGTTEAFNDVATDFQTNPTPADFFVIKFDPQNSQITYSVFLDGNRPDPTLGTFAPDYTVTLNGTFSGYDEIGIFNVYSPMTAGISDIRIGTTFESVAPLAPLPVPEPATLSLLAVGSLGLLSRRRRRA